MEKFSKISGLNKLKAKNLQKKTDKGLINIKNERQLMNSLLKEDLNLEQNLNSNLKETQNKLLLLDKSFLILNSGKDEVSVNEGVNSIKETQKKTEKVLTNNVNANVNYVTNTNTNNILTNKEDLLKKDEVKIGDYLNSKDIIYFELEFEEIWLEVEMTLISDDNKSLVISFEMKVQVDELISNLTKLLIKNSIMGTAPVPHPPFIKAKCTPLDLLVTSTALI